MIHSSTNPGDLIFLTWQPDTGLDEAEACARQAYQEIGAQLQANGQLLLHERIYGSLDAAGRFLQARTGRINDLGLTSELAVPPTWVEGKPCATAQVAGIHAIATGADLSETMPVMGNGSTFGRLVHGTEADYLMLSDLSRQAGGDGTLDAGAETGAVFTHIEQTLTELGWSFSDICRTWFYLRQILDWYDDFNDVRNRAFGRIGLLGGAGAQPIIPASTGIGGCNPRHSWCTLDLLAVRPRAGCRLEISRLVNPQQNEAPEYGSAFSRGLRVSTEHCTYLFVSGTASIDISGASVHDGDFERQTELTLETVSSLLQSAGAGPGQICQATAFLKQAEHRPLFPSIFQRHGFAGVPALTMIGDVCRPELLFELDATAVLPHGLAACRS